MQEYKRRQGNHRNRGPHNPPPPPPDKTLVRRADDRGPGARAIYALIESRSLSGPYLVEQPVDTVVKDETGRVFGYFWTVTAGRLYVYEATDGHVWSFFVLEGTIHACKEYSETVGALTRMQAKAEAEVAEEKRQAERQAGKERR